MFKFRPTKISHRLTLTYAVLFFTALALVNFATLFSINYYINQTSAQQLWRVDQAIATDVKTLNDIPNIDLKNLSQIAENTDINLIYNDRSLYNTGELYNLPAVDTSTIGRTLKGESGNNKIMYLNNILILDGGETITVQIVKDMDNEEDFLRVLAVIMLIMDVVVLLLAIIVGYIISRRALSPIDKITNQAKKISASDLSARIHIDGPDDELKRLSDTFNDLIGRIQHSYEKQNRFTLDASHELATPLAVIKGYIDVLDRWGKGDREVLNESISSIKVELANMTGLLDMLLFLSKGDNEIYKVEKTKFWVNDLIKELVKESTLVDEKHHIFCSAYPQLQMEGDRRLIKQMLRAIMDNSIKYSPQDTKIEIEYWALDKKVVIEISDEGIGIPEEDLAQVFDRFYRVDKARSRSIGGSGLGLSLVKWIVDIHNGRIEAESEIGKGTKMMVELPIEA
ncbi:sensor histidine kinase [Parasporobacterium paucivorans]|uniref:histidine kinase n=1 Tax=Parasporobacterium paucivorans DSM 15970 TaxID=1122934 RepID=A0A1M6D238_9FIRM|nr:ATP-binding protein [Parasporobacterium paucivorans]SHI67306.1 Signal transduction histidine kinase [Parasporobacterium paucivorans DSM 15970]